MKRYFAYVIDGVTGLFVRESGYFDTLPEAKRWAKANALTWRGYWAISDTTKKKGSKGFTVAFSKKELAGNSHKAV